MEWIYAVIGDPMWDFYEWGQAVMFYESRGPWSPGIPPMTDGDCAALEAANRRSRCITDCYDPV